MSTIFYKLLNNIISTITHPQLKSVALVCFEQNNYDTDYL